MKPRESALSRPVAMRLAATEARTLDAIDFCRAVSRRPASLTLDELLNAEVPF